MISPYLGTHGNNGDLIRLVGYKTMLNINAQLRPAKCKSFSFIPCDFDQANNEIEFSKIQGSDYDDSGEVAMHDPCFTL